MSGGLGKTQRHLLSLASVSSEEPGSVIAANCQPAPLPSPLPCRERETCSQQYAKCDRVSVVSPDFEATMKRVVGSLIRDRTPRIVAGSVVSRTCNRGCPRTTPKVLRRTSGHRLEPPMPSSTTSVYSLPSLPSATS